MKICGCCLCETKIVGLVIFRTREGVQKGCFICEDCSERDDVPQRVHENAMDGRIELFMVASKFFQFSTTISMN